MIFFQQKVYPYLPVQLQNFAISVFGYHWQRRRFGGIFKQELVEFKKRESFSKQQWELYQVQQLRDLLVHSYNTVSYYKQLFDSSGLNPAKLKAFELSDLKTIPLLEKNTLRRLGKTDLISSEREPGGTFFSSSGSTGTPVNILFSLKTHQKISAIYEARVRNWAGIKYTDSRAMIGGRRIVPTADANPPYYRYNFFEKQLYFSAYHLSKTNAENYFEGLRKYKPAYIVGYATSNYILAKYFRESGLVPPKMKAVLTSSEKLTNEMRKVLMDVYQCKVYDAWSGVEWCGLISENEYGQLLISPDCAIVEVIKGDGTHALPGEEGELVCTGFLNFDQPLIRYRIGDRVKLAKDQTAKCGRNFPVVEEIIGRNEEVVVGADGRQMVRFHGVFLDLPNVMRAQVVQDSLHDFTVNVETDGLTNDERESIKKRLESQLGKIHLQINEVKQIPVGNNGKFKAVISKVKSL